MKNVFLIKDGDKVRHFFTVADMNAAGFNAADKTVTEEEFNSNGCYARIIGNSIVVGRTPEEIVAEENAAELAELKAEIAARDYRALKAVKLGKTLVEVYPDEPAWYEEKLARIHELEVVLGIE
jgi:hypothetical protein